MPASTASWSPRAAPPPGGIIVAASQLSTEDASPIVAMRAKRVGQPVIGGHALSTFLAQRTKITTSATARPYQVIA